MAVWVSALRLATPGQRHRRVGVITAAGELHGEPDETRGRDRGAAEEHDVGHDSERLPEIDVDRDPLNWCLDSLQQPGKMGRRLPLRRHTFSHFHLDIEPVEILLNQPGCGVLEAGSRLWYNARQPKNVGLAAPVARLLKEVAGE